MCKSGYIDNGKCAAGLKSKNKGRMGEKPQTQVCAYEDAQGTESATKLDSKCGYAMTPSAYCPIGAGDDEFTKVLNQVNALH